MTASAEERLKVQFPPSMRNFLKVHNGLYLPEDVAILGVPPVSESTNLDVVTATLLDRKSWEPENLITITSDGTGDAWVLLPSLVDERGEYPVAKIDHETGEIMSYGASSYERFLWFQLDLLQRFFEPDGKGKQAYYQYIGMASEDWDDEEDPEWLDEEPYLPWPYKDLSWILQRDPNLVRLRPLDIEG